MTDEPLEIVDGGWYQRRDGLIDQVSAIAAEANGGRVRACRGLSGEVYNQDGEVCCDKNRDKDLIRRVWVHFDRYSYPSITVPPDPNPEQDKIEALARDLFFAHLTGEESLAATVEDSALISWGEAEAFYRIAKERRG